MSSRRKLPIGIQTFRTIREEGCYYVDKTAYIDLLLDEGTHYFLSRPRRFGKSLFLNTLKELFEGNEALFEGLAIHGRRDWSVRHPVLRLSFGYGNFKEPGYLHRNLMEQLDAVERRTGVICEYYASVFYSYFAGLGLDVTVEDSTSHGRLDMAVCFNANVYLFEFKVVELEPAGEAAPRSAAMAQLKERRYADKYRHLGQPTHLIAVEFSKEARNVVAFEVERAA